MDKQQNEGYPPNWVRLVLMVSPAGEFHSIGGTPDPNADPRADCELPGMARLRKRLAERTPQDYAVEHAEYMAVAGEALLRAVNALGELMVKDDESEQAIANMEAASSAVGECATGLRECIYEFRKRRDRAATSGVDECDTCRKPLPEGCKTEFQGEPSCALTYGVQPSEVLSEGEMIRKQEEDIEAFARGV